jgi:CRP-like cAMP-binding protein
VIGDALLTHLLCTGSLSAEDAGAIRLVKGEVRTIRRHKDVLSTGDVPRFAIVVLKGCLCRYTTSARGTRQIHGFCTATNAPSLESLHLDYVDDNLGTLVSSVVGLVPHANLVRLMEERPGIAAIIRRAGVLQGSIYRQWLIRNSTQPADASMAHLFCETYVRADAAGLVSNGSCDLPVTQENLGEALGLTAVHVNRTLQQLRQTGLVELKLGRLYINNLNEIAKLAEFDPRYLHLRAGAGSSSRQRSPTLGRQRIVMDTIGTSALQSV